MPDWARRCIDEFRRLNTDHEVRVHGEDALLPEYRHLYDKATDLASKADLLRYSVLEREGGWYFDADTWPLRPLVDIEHAYRPDGSRMLIGAQYPATHRLWIANGAIGVAADWPGWPAFREMLLATTETGRVAYGPALVTRFCRQHAGLVDVIAKPWFYGVGPEWAGKLYRCAIHGRFGGFRRIAETAGQLPFSFHLWHGNKRVTLSPYPPANDACVFGDGDRTAIVATNSTRPSEDLSHMWSGIVQGLLALGFRVERRPIDSAFAQATEVPEVAVTWNGMRAGAAQFIEDVGRFGVTTIRLEHGFFGRKRYSQADHEGILHWASWRHDLRGPAPAEGAEKLAQFYPQGLTPMQRRRGYILVVGQVTNDTQMFESSIQGPVPLQRLIYNATKGLTRAQVYFRPHPGERGMPRQQLLKLLPQAEDARGEYVRTKHGLGLAEALEGAAFVLTINSNAINEALALGVPCLAFGPHLGIEAGVVRQTTAAMLAADIDAMLDGWVPNPEAVENYLRWLACRQWAPEEFAQPDVMRQLVEAAGVSVSADAEVACG